MSRRRTGKVVVAKELSSVLALLHYNNFRDFSGKILWPFFYGEGGPYPEKDALKDGEGLFPGLYLPYRRNGISG